MAKILVELDWERRSSILWIAEHEGRTFRIQRAHSQVHAPVVLSEVDSRQREIKRQAVSGYQDGRKVAQTWLQGS